VRVAFAGSFRGFEPPGPFAGLDGRSASARRDLVNGFVADMGLDHCSEIRLGNS